MLENKGECSLLWTESTLPKEQPASVDEAIEEFLHNVGTHALLHYLTISFTSLMQLVSMGERKADLNDCLFSFESTMRMVKALERFHTMEEKGTKPT